jgi:hypothetical protein
MPVKDKYLVDIDYLVNNIGAMDDENPNRTIIYERWMKPNRGKIGSSLFMFLEYEGKSCGCPSQMKVDYCQSPTPQLTSYIKNNPLILSVDELQKIKSKKKLRKVLNEYAKLQRIFDICFRGTTN